MSIQSIRDFMTKNYMPPQGFESYKGRRVAYGQQVKVYRNLHKHSASGGSVYSIADAETGLVLGYSQRVTLQDAEFKVSEAGRQRVLREQKKNVHAFVVGTFAGTLGAGQDFKARYNPYRYETFVNDAGEPLYDASIVTVAEDGVTYSI